MPQRTGNIQRAPAFPPSGATVIVAGDSLSDLAPWNALAPLANGVTGYGQWATRLCTAMGWTRINQPMIPNGNFETDCNTIQSAQASGFGYQPVNCTLARTAYSAGVVPAYGNGGFSLKATASAAAMQVGVGATTGTSYNGLNGNNALSGAAVRLFLQPSTAYTLSALVAHPVANSAASAPRAVVAINGGSGFAFSISAQAVTKGVAAMTQISVGFTTPAAITDSQVSFDLTTNVAGDVLYLDNIQLEANTVGGGGGAGVVTPFGDFNWRGAIASSLLADHGNVSGFAANLQDTAGNRLTTNTTTGAAWSPAAVIIHAGVNDIQQVGAASHPMTLATWRTGVGAILAYLAGLTPRPYVAIGGIANSIRQPSPVPASPFYTSLDDLVAQMDAATAALAQQYGALFVRCRAAPPIEQIDALTLGSIGVHPTPDGMTALANRYLDAIHRGY